MKRWWMLLMLLVLGVGMVGGCEVEGDADDDGGSLKVDVDD